MCIGHASPPSVGVLPKDSICTLHNVAQICDSSPAPSIAFFNFKPSTAECWPDLPVISALCFGVMGLYSHVALMAIRHAARTLLVKLLSYSWI